MTGASYTVKPGDTLAGIAHRAGSTTAELKQINNLRSDYVQVGQELKLPSGSAPAAMEAAHNPPPAAPAGPSTVKTPEGAVTHEVKAGETVGVIARKYHVKTQDLLVANNIADPRKIRAGQILVIPGATASSAAVSASSPGFRRARPSAVRRRRPARSLPLRLTEARRPCSPCAGEAPGISDSGMKPQADVPVIKVDDSPETKTP